MKLIQGSVSSFQQVRRVRASRLVRLLAIAGLLLSPVGALADVNAAAAKTLNPCAAKTLNPCAAKTLNPCAAKTLNAAAAKTLNPCAAKTLNAAAAKTLNPCAAKTLNAAAAKTLNPCAAKTLNAAAAKTLNPCVAKVLNPCVAKTLNPCKAKSMNPCSTKNALKPGKMMKGAMANPCNPCNPCGGGGRVDQSLFVQPRGALLSKGKHSKLVARGEKLWNDASLGKAGISCAGCHVNQYMMMNPTFKQPYPHHVAMAKDRAGVSQVNAAEMVNFCMVVPMKADPLAWGSTELASLAAYVESLQDGYQPMGSGGSNPCNPCSMKKGNPCNPCSMKKGNPCSR